ncbi:uncharacterized protein LOC133035128 [Cannabis sativa]|uniref:uncharacterized protein LOC133035128 n=1 Tax=Cannabis sativa TaxID=3483 RepID=UPI0029C9D514|nr:uncharacterized protein LOC133035128 [Cannabis sativa]
MEQSSVKQRVSWRNMDVVKTFLETCIQEVYLHGRLGSSLKPDSWNKVRLVLETTHSFFATQKQLKNHFDYLKYKYQTWFPITMKIGNVYDPTTNTILMSNAEWDEYIKAHPKAKSLKSAPLPFPDLYKARFDGTTATGFYGWSLSCTISRPINSSTSLNIETDAYAEENTPINQNDEADNTSPSQYSIPLGGQKKKRKLSSQHDIDDKMSVALELLIEKNSGPEVENYMEKLDGLGWEEPLYSETIGILCEGAIGVLDGTLVHAVISLDKQTTYRGRGKGWKGVAHDSRVLKEIVANPNNCFPFPLPNKYYLCDAAYPCSRRFLPPYHNVRYWLGDYRRRCAVTKEEKFNHAHAQLRNVIERSFGILKARFPILDKIAPYEFHVQRDVVIACFTINNFIRKERINDELFNQFDQLQVIFEEGLEEQIMEETNEPS